MNTIDVITSRNNPLVKKAFALKKDDSEFFLVEGHHLVEMASTYGLLEEVFALKDPHLSVKTHLVNDSIIEKLSSTQSPEGIVGIVKKKKAKGISSPRLLVLDRIQDPGNLGTLLRTALAFSFLDVICLTGTTSSTKSKAIMASQGAIFGLNILYMNEEEAVALLKKEGYFLLGSSLDQAVELKEFAFPKGKIALIVGNEGQGMSTSLKKRSDANVKIEIEGIDSLNAGVAGGILMHAIYGL